MPRRKMDPNDPNALSEHIAAMVTKDDMANVQRVAKALGVNRSTAVRLILRAGFRAPHLTPTEEHHERQA